MGTDTVTVTRDDVRAARERLGGLVRHTPVIRVGGDELGGPHGPFLLKLESLQSTGSFKARGALNTMLAGDLPAAGVCAASGGNHGQAVAWAARRLGVPASIFVPATCPEVKLRRIKGYGAAVTVVGDVYEDSLVHAELHASRTGAVLVHPFDSVPTVAGAGTVIAEFAEDVPELDTLLVAVGGGGLLSGALAWLAGSGVSVVAVEPYSCRTLGAALDAGEPVDVAVSGPAVDSLGPRRAGSIAFRAASLHRVPYVNVTDEAIVGAQLAAWEALRVGLEGGGATALSALLSGVYRPSAGETVGVLACGGNVDLTALPAVRP